MSWAWPCGSAVLHVLGRLPLLLPLLLLWRVPAAVRGDCGLPPDLPNAMPDLRELSTFLPGDTVTYTCDTNFVKIPGLSDTATCQESHQWSEMQPFCNRSCEDPPHLIYASLKRPYRDQNYFPVGSTVEYECRLGYRRDQGKPTITCLENLEWSQPEQFCTKKRCPHPGEITNGDIRIETDLLYGSTIYFSCETGYQLIGAASSFCLASEHGVNWSNKLPICQEVQCPDPPPIENGRIREESASYVYRQVVSYQCNKGFVMVGDGNTFCNEEGAWSTPLPECRGKNAAPKTTVSTTSSTQRPSQSSGPGIEVPPTTRKPSSASTSGTRLPPTSQEPTTVNTTVTRVSPLPQKYITTRLSPTPQRPTTVNIPARDTMPTPQRPTTVNVPARGTMPAPQRPTTVNIPARDTMPAPQRLTTVNVPDTMPTPQKHTTTRFSPTPQKPPTINVSAADTMPTPQKITTVNVTATDITLVSQKIARVNASVTRLSSTPEKPPTVNVPAIDAAQTHQQPITANVPATRPPLTPQKIATVNVPATDATRIPQKPTSIKASSPRLLPTSQRPTMINASVTKAPATAQTPPISNASSTNTPVAAQNPTMAKAPASQPPPTSQRVTVRKPSFTHSLSTTKFTAFHTPLTKGLHSTTSLTSAPITATQEAPVSTTTKHTKSTPASEHDSSSGASKIILGKFDSQTVKNSCHPCGVYNPFSWERISSFYCLRKTARMQCVWLPQRTRVHALYRHVVWTPLGTQYVPLYSKSCSCSKVIAGRLQILWPASQVLLRAHCINTSF
ncbi:complement decay-accelerating factor [Ochotona princeps]|uniref:complement decay-accelerating factor n=1 Tax=Ochotona princeps TaxID=9978 RepID=UPI00271477A4|nr:complement decay-accelerating factor [Ochotona princeps]